MQQYPLLPDTVYHIYNHANGAENLFRSDENYYYFLRKYGAYIYPIADTYAYCLMPNHFHLMVRIRDEQTVLQHLQLKKPTLQANIDLTGFENLSGLITLQFSNFFNAYAKAYNKMYLRRGSLFERQFKRKPITEEDYFLQLIAYIHYNPIHHGFCTDIFDWHIVLFTHIFTTNLQGSISNI
ncbi:MAG: transposase [Chitinophagales bacterium]|nr:transposase [Chitinophagales bacterium]